MSNLSRSVFQGHPFHLVSPSPWPILTCVSLLDLTTSGVLSMHGFTYAAYWLPLALTLLISSMFFWFRDVISEGTYIGNHTLAVQKGLNIGISLFIISEALFFLAIFLAYYHSGLSPVIEWPYICIELVNTIELSLLDTVILLASGVIIISHVISIRAGYTIAKTYISILIVIVSSLLIIYKVIVISVASLSLIENAYGLHKFVEFKSLAGTVILISFAAIFICTVILLDFGPAPMPNKFSRSPMLSMSIMPYIAAVIAFSIAVIHVGADMSEVTKDIACVSSCLTATSSGLIGIPVDITLSNGTIISQPILVHHLFAHHEAFTITKESLSALSSTLAQGKLSGIPGSPGTINGLPTPVWWIVLSASLLAGFVVMKSSSTITMVVFSKLSGGVWVGLKFVHLVGDNHLFAEGFLGQLACIGVLMPWLDGGVDYVHTIFTGFKQNTKDVIIGGIGGVIGTAFVYRN